jgi:L-serine dehydratase
MVQEGRKTFWEFVEDNEGRIYGIPTWCLAYHAGNDKAWFRQRGVLPGPIKLARAPHRSIQGAYQHGTLKSFGLLFSFALAVAEENAAGGRIVTAPTCGSSGVLPAILFYLSREEYLTEVKILRALATAG